MRTIERVAGTLKRRALRNNVGRNTTRTDRMYSRESREGLSLYFTKAKDVTSSP